MKSTYLIVGAFVVYFGASTLSLFAQTVAPAQPTLPGIPGIGFVGTLVGNYGLKSEDKDLNSVGVREFELEIQHPIYTGVTAVGIIGLSNEGAATETSIENGYLRFSELYDGFNITVGRQFVPFGKWNTLHAEQWATVDRPAVLQDIFGEENLTADGLNIAYQFPVPFFLSGQIGYWKQRLDLASMPPFQPTDYMSSARLWSSYELSADSELEIGVSYLNGAGPSYKTGQDIVTIYGGDATLKWWLNSTSRIFAQSEIIRTERRLDSGTQQFTGGFIQLGYQPDRKADVTVRLDRSTNPDSQQLSQWVTGAFTYKLTDTYFSRIQYRHDLESGRDIVSAQMTFVIGAHSHPLQ
ncbi:hypothetical protein EBR96_03970 [bacterium]|nr:hypothetical protein [bacterium]